MPTDPVAARPAFPTPPAGGTPGKRLDRLAALVPQLGADAVEAERDRLLPSRAVEANAVTVAEIQPAVNPLVLGAAQRLFDGGGASAAGRTLGLDRHGRNAQTIAGHNPIAYKAHTAGAWAVSHTPPPNSGF